MKQAERVEVMLSVLPWLAATGGAPLVETAERFGVDPEALRADLESVNLDVEPVVGPDSMVQVDFGDHDDDDWVSVILPGSFEQPPELTHSEALVLLAAGSALLGERDSHLALAPAVDKLVTVLGPGAERALDVDLGAGDPDLRTLLRRGVDEQLTVSIGYFSWSSDEVSTRTVDPWALNSVNGNWYLTGWCHDRRDSRHFRLDRVLSAELTDAAVKVPAPAEVPYPQPGIGEPNRVVSVTLPATHAWLVDSYPLVSFEDLGEQVSAQIAVYSDGWLDRLLVRLPPDATVADASGADLAARRREVARRIIDATGIAGSGGSVTR